MFLTKEHAAMNVEGGKVGKPYRPANGTEGEIFFECFCDRCTKQDSCQLPSNSMLFFKGEELYPKEFQYNADGQPTCTAFEERK